MQRYGLDIDFKDDANVSILSRRISTKERWNSNAIHQLRRLIFEGKDIIHLLM